MKRPVSPTRDHQPSRRFRPRRSDRLGTTSVEFALVAPIIFTLFLGAIEMTRFNFIRHTAANAAYEAARTGIVPGATEADCRKKATDLLTAVGAGSSVTVDYQSTTKTVRVSVTIPVNQNSWAIGRFTHGLNLVQSCTLSREIL
jgi:Flp pilus assembly protein TadG